MIVCFFGDSVTNGVGDPQALGWVGRLVAAAKSAGSDLTGYNLGVRRHSSAAILARFEDETTRRYYEDQPMGLVFAFGMVDALAKAGLPLEETVANTRQILERSAALGQVLFVGPSPAADRRSNEAIAARGGAIAVCCRELGVPYLDIFPELQASELYLDELVGGDGVHPGQAGYSHIFRLVESWAPWRNLVAHQPAK